MRIPRHPSAVRLFSLPLCIILALFSWSCSRSAEGEDDKEIREAAPLDCTTLGYPCTLAEVSVAVRERSFDLGQEVAQRIAEGEAPQAVADWLNGLDEMEEVFGPEQSIGFRLAGGRTVWVLFAPGRLLPTDEEAVLELRDVAQPLNASPQDVVKRDRDDPDSKYARVLAPFYDEFYPHEDAHWVRDHLNEVRGYKENPVHYRANGDATLDEFRGWENYDVIHISTHGDNSCSFFRCVTYMMTGQRLTREQWSESKLDIFEQTGWDPVFYVAAGPGSWARPPYLAVTADFFRDAYPNGLDRAIVTASACLSLKDSDLAEALIGASTEFYGWDDAVLADDAAATTRAFYEIMSKRGITGSSALAQLRAQGYGRSVYEDDEGTDQQRSVDARFLRMGSAHMRLREVVTLVDDRGAELRPDQAIDSETPPAFELVAHIEGIEEQDVTVNFFVDGQQLGSDRVLNPSEARVRKLDETTYEFRLELEMPFGIPSQGLVVDLEARVDLPGGGDSRHFVEDVRLRREDCAENGYGSIESELYSASSFEGEMTLQHSGVGPTVHATLSDSDQLQISIRNEGGCVDIVIENYDGPGSYPEARVSLSTPAERDISASSFTHCPHTINVGVNGGTCLRGTFFATTDVLDGICCPGPECEEATQVITTQGTFEAPLNVPGGPPPCR